MSAPEDLVLNTQRTLIYRVCRGIVAVLSQILFHPTVEGRERIPMDGPVIIAPIHRSNVDFAVSVFISPRKVFFMAKHGLFEVPILGPLLIRLGAFPVRRGSADRESMGRAEEVLRRGQALVLFPEGTRKDGLHVEPLHFGAMFIAARTKAWVVPVGIAGTERAMPHGAKLPRFAKVHVVIGTPLAPPESSGRVSRSQLSAKSEELRAALEAVYQEAMSR
ncbi:MAG: 1-acyl-sn-glycerol-3-phosphate acyltransferase [Acidobacteriota bacterium]|nr:1-acyl-sn-glycerol-3-phosphate acyltransferase [Acidobacteriota bacterium]MDE3043800.1 1-acyl-sn-glycerol-3-phosphate acyltransferase [Acidobacteriota bacterium]MDE3106694.1 1-acyl-sn-glycerol-3-phosphate acyltransferase [Acidobacteriota bacterium]MDE3223234.1 1-acyl-sn-glycerol-3-phosphate acyltransferase [Acidobacteriota bacterium]